MDCPAQLKTVGRCHVQAKQRGWMCFRPCLSSVRDEAVSLHILRSDDGLKGNNLGCVLWMSEQCLNKGASPEIFMSYTLNSQVWTEALPLKAKKVEKVTKKKKPLREMVYRMNLSAKDYGLLKDIQDVLLPLVEKVLAEIMVHPGFYNENGAVPLHEVLQSNPVGISLENEGFALLKLLPDRMVSHTLLRFNTHRVCAELLTPASMDNTKDCRETKKHTVVDSLASALHTFNNRQKQWPVIPAHVVEGIASPRKASYASQHGSDFSMEREVSKNRSASYQMRDVRQDFGELLHAQLGIRKKGIMEETCWEVEAMKAVVQIVAGLSMPKSPQLFDLASRATRALLTTESCGSPVAQTFIDSVRQVIERKGTECRAINKLLLDMLDIPCVEQAVRSSLLESISNQDHKILQQQDLARSTQSHGREAMVLDDYEAWQWFTNSQQHTRKRRRQHFHLSHAHVGYMFQQSD